MLTHMDPPPPPSHDEFPASHALPPPMPTCTPNENEAFLKKILGYISFKDIQHIALSLYSLLVHEENYQ